MAAFSKTHSCFRKRVRVVGISLAFWKTRARFRKDVSVGKSSSCFRKHVQFSRTLSCSRKFVHVFNSRSRFRKRIRVCTNVCAFSINTCAFPETPWYFHTHLRVCENAFAFLKLRSRVFKRVHASEICSCYKLAFVFPRTRLRSRKRIRVS